MSKYTLEQITARREARKEARKEAKKAAETQAQKDQKPVKKITISIEWSKSRTGGSNPHAEAEVEYRDGTFERRDGFTASGCGYDKRSTVIAEIFNAFLRYKLWQLSKTRIKGGHGTGSEGSAPYGITSYGKTSRGFSGGIGTSCYRSISEYIGGKFECVAEGKTFDVYTYSDKRKKA